MKKTAATLPEELVLEILPRVTDVATLFRCATACKRWRRIIADPFFLRHIWPKCAHHPPSSVLGFFSTRPGPDLMPAFVPLPRMAIGFGRSFLGSSACGTIALASRGSLLLVRLVQLEQSDPHQSYVRLAVCDPIAGAFDLLPPLICHGSYSRIKNYAILTDADFCSSTQEERRPLPGYSTFFEVIIIDHCSFNLYMFSSTEPSWSTTNQCIEQADDRPFVSLRPYGPAVHHATPHWLVGDSVDYYLLGVSAETGNVLLTNISMPMNHHHTSIHGLPRLSVTADGMLSLLWLHKDGRRLVTWTRGDDGENEDDDAGWFPSPVIELNLPERRQTNEGAPYLCLAERNHVLLIRDNVKRFYVVDLKAGTPMEEVTDSFRGLIHSARVVPFEVDLPAFFLSRHRSGSE